MQSGLGQARARARLAGIDRRCQKAAVLLLGLALTGCVSAGQIANLTEAGRTSLAIESIDGAPSAVMHTFVRALKNEADARQIAVVPPDGARYRLRGYLAAHDEGAAATSIAWVLDLYDVDQRRAFRLSGKETVAGRAWPVADEEVLNRIARNSVRQFAAFTATAGTPAASADPLQQKAASVFGWFDDWAPEASGIFRLLRREPSKPEIAADAAAPLRPEQVPLPKGRPAPVDEATSPTLAFAPEIR